MASVYQPALRLANLFTARLFWWLVVAAALGVLLPATARSLEPAVPVILSVMIGGLGLGLPLKELGAGFLRPRLLALALAVQLISTPLVGFLLWRASGSPSSLAGLVVQATAPSEITSPLMVQIAGGSLAAALPIMAASVLLAPITMPVLLRFTLGQAVPVPVAAMLRSLSLTVALPLLLGSIIHTAFRKPKTLRAVGPGISALMVVLLIFVVVGSAAEEVDASSAIQLLTAAAASFALFGAGTGGGWLAARVFNLDRSARHALVFTTGMREFGIASAVALSFFDARTALVPAIYGVVMMLTSAWLAGRIRNRSSHQP